MFIVIAILLTRIEVDRNAFTSLISNMKAIVVSRSPNLLVNLMFLECTDKHCMCMKTSRIGKQITKT